MNSATKNDEECCRKCIYCQPDTLGRCRHGDNDFWPPEHFPHVHLDVPHEKEKCRHFRRGSFMRQISEPEHVSPGHRINELMAQIRDERRAQQLDTTNADARSIAIARYLDELYEEGQRNHPHRTMNIYGSMDRQKRERFKIVIAELRALADHFRQSQIPETLIINWIQRILELLGEEEQ